MVCISLYMRIYLRQRLTNDLGIVNKLTTILTYSFENNVDSFYEPILGILFTLALCQCH